MRRRQFIGLLCGAATILPIAARAQQAAKIAQIGFLGVTTGADLASRAEALRAGLRELGYVEGKNLVIESRYADGKFDRLPELAAELVRLKVDVIVTHATPGTRAAQRATVTIPIVIAASADAVAAGLVASLSHPGGNTTGLTFFNPELMGKRLELLKELIPKVTRVAVLINPNNPANRLNLQATGVTAKSLDVEIKPFEAREPNEFANVFSAMVKENYEGVVVSEDPILIANVNGIAELASKHRLPSVGFREFVQVGGLISYGADLRSLFQRAAYFVDKILKGTKPGDLPVEQPTKFELIANLKTARALGLTVPPQLLTRADEVIE
jgi:putative ABC transport system substrate-binding protein